MSFDKDFRENYEHRTHAKVVETPPVIVKDHVVYARCHMCLSLTRIEMSRKGYEMWQDGMLIQRALPELTDDERELLISQTCPKCWNILFPPEEE